MKISTKNSIKVGCIIIGTITGAGFASGQEILQFFTVFRNGGLKGILLSGALFFIVCFSVLDYIFSHKIDGYSKYINVIAGKYAGIAIEVIVMLFLLTGFFIMIAGTGAFFSEFFGIKAIFGAGFMAALCCIVFLFGVKGVVNVNTILAPILVCGIFIIGAYIGAFAESITVYTQGKKLVNDWVSSAIVYVSYNSIILVAILSNTRSYLDSRKTVFWGAAFGAGMLCVMALVMYFITSSYYASVIDSQMPIIKVIKDIKLPAGWIYGIVLLCAMFTSCVSSGFCFLNRASDFLPFGRKFNAFLIGALSLPLSVVSFSDMIGWLYPIFGYLGIFQIIVVVCGWVLSLKGNRGLLFRGK